MSPEEIFCWLSRSLLQAPPWTGAPSAALWQPARHWLDITCCAGTGQRHAISPPQQVFCLPPCAPLDLLRGGAHRAPPPRGESSRLTQPALRCTPNPTAAAPSLFLATHPPPTRTAVTTGRLHGQRCERGARRDTGGAAAATHPPPLPPATPAFTSWAVSHLRPITAGRARWRGSGTRPSPTAHSQRRRKRGVGGGWGRPAACATWRLPPPDTRSEGWLRAGGCRGGPRPRVGNSSHFSAVDQWPAPCHVTCRAAGGGWSWAHVLLFFPCSPTGFLRVGRALGNEQAGPAPRGKVVLTAHPGRKGELLLYRDLPTHTCLAVVVGARRSPRAR